MILKGIAISSWIVGLSLLVVFNDATAEVKLLVASLGLLMFVKLAAYLWQVADGARAPGVLGTLCFFFAWPGVRLHGFQKRETSPVPETGERFLESWCAFFVGLMGVTAASVFGDAESTVWKYVALYSFLLIFHLGLVEVMIDGLRLLGFSPQSQFDRPFLAKSLRDFWSFRWNLSFIDMNKIFFLKTFKNTLPSSVLVFLIFLISGILHELAISYPVNAGWGLPLLYFAIQGAGFLIERKFPFPRPLVLAWIILPSPILFHTHFVDGLVVKLLCAYGGFIESITPELFWTWALSAGGLLHLLVLVASVQVPRELKWKEQFALLTNLNRKVVWTYGAYIFCIILFLSATSFYLSGLSYSTPGIGLWPLFISLFWWARVGIDTLYMKHSDWPQGPLFKVGHVCLTTLFLTLSVVYSVLCVLAWRGSL